jgi:hypothetical protein
MADLLSDRAALGKGLVVVVTTLLVRVRWLSSGCCDQVTLDYSVANIFMTILSCYRD